MRTRRLEETSARVVVGITVRLFFAMSDSWALSQNICSTNKYDYLPRVRRVVVVLKKLNETAMGGTQLPRLGWKSLGLKNKSMFRRWTRGLRESKLDLS